MSSKKKQGEEFKQEDIFLAILVADSFNHRFAPLAQNKPKSLLPLANIPLIDYTLESLSAGGIEQVLVATCFNSEQIKQHVLKSKWSKSGSSMEVDVVVMDPETCLSLGDVMRHIDTESLVKSDFVLISGDVISNVPLKLLIEDHKQRKQRDKSMLMTLLYKSAPPGHTTRTKEEDMLVAIKNSDNRILFYQKTAEHKNLELPLEIFQDHNDVLLRSDLLDTHISICSPLVPQLFTDNFDYATKDHFIKGIIENEEILGNTIHMKDIGDQYAARASNLQMYDSVSKDVLSRWSYPYVPDYNLTNLEGDKYTYGRHNIYLHKEVTLARGCVVDQNVIIGKGTSVGSNSKITKSVIGKNCVIGENVQITNSYLWDGVKLENECTVSTAIIGENVHVKSNVKVPMGCVLAENVVIGPDIDLPCQTKLMAHPPVKEDDGFSDDEDTAEVEVNPALVGSQGQGYVYEPPVDSDEEAEEELVNDLWGLQIESEEDYSIGSASSEEEEDEVDAVMMDEGKMFYNEVVGTIARTVEENIGLENLILEVNSLKHAYGVQIGEVWSAVTRAVVMFPLEGSGEVNPQDYWRIFQQNFDKLKRLLKNYIKEAQSEATCLAALERSAISSSVVNTALLRILKTFYDGEVLSEENIIKWHSSPIEGTEDIQQRKDIRKQLAPFINWLQEADEETDEETDSD